MPGSYQDTELTAISDRINAAIPSHYDTEFAILLRTTEFITDTNQHIMDLSLFLFHLHEWETGRESEYDEYKDLVHWDALKLPSDNEVK